LNAAASAALLEAFTAISASAALAIRRESGERSAQIKADGSPVTAADQIAEAVIRDGLERFAPEFPVVSEERIDQTRVSFKNANVILVDPLDGTRDFIAGRDEYTVNIALVTDGVPALGVITAPALGLMWRGIVGCGAERLQFGDDGKTSPPRAIETRPAPNGELTVMVSRSHLEAQTKAYVEGLRSVRLLQSGSAIKFCRIAEGAADHYPRLAPTRDWDVAAGHAILKAAGGSLTAPNGSPIVYGTQALIIPGFLAWGDVRG